MSVHAALPKAIQMHSMTDDHEKNQNRPTNPKSVKTTRVNPRKKAPAEASNAKTKNSDPAALLTIIVSFLLILVISFLMFCAICVQAGIYLLQVRQMKKSTEAATKAANAAEASVRQVRTTARHDERAWIALVDIQGIPEVGTMFSVNLVSQNSGKTFAKNLTMRAVIEIAKKGEEPDFSLDDSDAARKDSGVSLLAPNADYVMDVELRKQTPPHEITQSDLDGIRSGNLVVFVHGRMTYDDIFGCSHWTSFCARLKPDLKYASYGRHNDTDQNSCP
jgi:hypothetical protein